MAANGISHFFFMKGNSKQTPRLRHPGAISTFYVSCKLSSTGVMARWMEPRNYRTLRYELIVEPEGGLFIANTTYLCLYQRPLVCHLELEYICLKQIYSLYASLLILSFILTGIRVHMWKLRCYSMLHSNSPEVFGVVSRLVVILKTTFRCTLPMSSRCRCLSPRQRESMSPGFAFWDLAHAWLLCSEAECTAPIPQEIWQKDIFYVYEEKAFVESGSDPAIA